MYFLKHKVHQDYLTHVDNCIPYWGSLENAKPFSSPKEVIDYIINSCISRNDEDEDEDELKEWLDVYTTIEKA